MRRNFDRQFSARAVQEFSATGFAPGLTVRNAADGSTEIMIYDAIGDDGWGGGVSATSVIDALRATKGGAVNVRVNSPGGDVFDGLAIYNALLSHPGVVTCTVDGVAASAASFIACAGTQTVMNESSMMMIHNASCVEWGDTRSMSAMADLLAKIDGQLAGIYAARSGKPVAEFTALMNAETWMTAAEAKANGLASAVVPAPKREAPPAALSLEVIAAAERRLRLRLAAV